MEEQTDKKQTYFKALQHLQSELNNCEWDKAKDNLDSIFTLRDKYDIFLPELISAVHIYAQHLIHQHRIDEAEALYFKFLLVAKSKLRAELYCNFLINAGDNYLSKQLYELALPYYTWALALIEKQHVCQEERDVIIKKITAIELCMSVHFLKTLIEKDLAFCSSEIHDSTRILQWLTHLYPLADNLTTLCKFDLISHLYDALRKPLIDCLYTLIIQASNSGIFAYQAVIEDWLPLQRWLNHHQFALIDYICKELLRHQEDKDTLKAFDTEPLVALQAKIKSWPVQVPNAAFFLNISGSGFWQQQRQQLHKLRSGLQSLPIDKHLDIKSIMVRQTLWNHEFKLFLNKSLKQIVAQLGPPPCVFSLMAVGSVGRGNATLYFDIDPFFLFQSQGSLDQDEKMRQHPYFEVLTHALRFHLSSLGDPWLLGKNYRQEKYRISQGVQLDGSDMPFLINKDVTHRYLIQTPTAMAQWVAKAYSYPEELQLLCYSLHCVKSIYQSDEKNSLFDDYLQALSQQSLQQNAVNFVKYHQDQFNDLIKPDKDPFKTINEQEKHNNPSIDLKQRLLSPLIYACCDLALAKNMPIHLMQKTTLPNIFAHWREHTFLTIHFIDIVEKSFNSLQALKFDMQVKRGGQPDVVLRPDIKLADIPEYDAAGIPLHLMPQLTRQQFIELQAINAVLHVFYSCSTNLLNQPNNTQFDPIKHIINHHLSQQPELWLSLLARLVATFITQPEVHLQYYQLLPDEYCIPYFEHLQSCFKGDAFPDVIDPNTHPILSSLYYYPNDDGLRPAMVQTHRQWRAQLRTLFQENVSDGQLNAAQQNKEWVVITSDLSNEESLQLKGYLLQAQAKRALFKYDGTFKPKEPGSPGRHTILPVNIGGFKVVAKLGPELPAIASGIHYLSWLIAGGGTPDDLICHFYNGKESLAVQFFRKIPTDLNLNEVVEKQPHLLMRITLKSFLKHLLRVLTTHPEDDKDNDYFLVPSAEQPGFFDIVRVDAERAFYEIEKNEVTVKLFVRRILQVKSMLLCMDHMQTRLDTDAGARRLLEDFTRLDLGKVCQKFFSYMAKLHEFYRELFLLPVVKAHLARTDPGASILTVPLPDKLVKDLWNRSCSLQLAIKFALEYQQPITGFFLLHSANPKLAAHYQAFFSKYPIDAQHPEYMALRFGQMDNLFCKDKAGRRQSRDTAIDAVSNSLSLATPFSIPDLIAITRGDRHSPQQALKILANLEKTQLNEIADLIKQGKAEGFAQFKLLTTRLQISLFENVSLLLKLKRLKEISKHNNGNMSDKEEKAMSVEEIEVKDKYNEQQRRFLLQAKAPVAFARLELSSEENEGWSEQQQRNLLQAMAIAHFPSLDLSLFANILTDELLIPLLQGLSEHLLELNISGCRKITASTINMIPRYCSQLRRLIINEYSGVELALSNTFLHLHYLAINDCPQLKMVQIDAPQLSKFHANNNSEMIDYGLTTDQLSELSLINCHRLEAHEEDLLVNLTPHFIILERLYLQGCDQFQHIDFRERHPYLLDFSFNRFSIQFMADLESAIIQFLPVDKVKSKQACLSVYNELAYFLKNIEFAKTILLKALKDSVETVRATVVAGLIEFFKRYRLLSSLSELLENSKADLRAAALAVVKGIIKSGTGVSNVTSVFIQAVNHSASDVKKVAITGIVALLKAGYIEVSLIDTLFRAFESPESYIRIKALKGLIVLMSQGHNERALNALLQALKDPDHEVSKTAVSILMSLISTGYLEFNEKILSTLFEDGDLNPLIREMIIFLFTDLIKFDNVDERIIHAYIQASSKESDNIVNEVGVNGLVKLIECGYSNENSLNALIQVLKNPDRGTSTAALSGLFELIRNRHAGEGMLNALILAFKDPCYDINKISIAVMIVLIKHGYVDEGVLNVWIQTVKDSDSNVNKASIALLIELVKHCHFDELVSNVFIEAVNDNDCEIRKLAVTGLIALIKLGHIEKRFLSALFHINKENNAQGIRAKFVVELITELIKLGYTDENALSALLQAAKAPTMYLRSVAMATGFEGFVVSQGIERKINVLFISWKDQVNDVSEKVKHGLISLFNLHKTDERVLCVLLQELEDLWREASKAVWTNFKESYENGYVDDTSRFLHRPLENLSLLIEEAISVELTKLIQLDYTNERVLDLLFQILENSDHQPAKYAALNAIIELIKRGCINERLLNALFQELEAQPQNVSSPGVIGLPISQSPVNTMNYVNAAALVGLIELIKQGHISKRVLDILFQVLEGPAQYVKFKKVVALSYFQAPENPEGDVRIVAIVGLIELIKRGNNDVKARNALFQAVRAGAGSARAMAIVGIIESIKLNHSDEQSLSALFREVNDIDKRVRIAVVAGLLELIKYDDVDERVFIYLVIAFGDHKKSVRHTVKEGLVEFFTLSRAAKRVVTALDKILNDSRYSNSVRRSAVRILIKLIEHGCVDESVLSTLFKVIRDTSWDLTLRKKALGGLKELINLGHYEERVLDSLVQTVTDTNSMVRSAALSGLAELIKRGVINDRVLNAFFQEAKNSVSPEVMTGLLELIKRGYTDERVQICLFQALNYQSISSVYHSAVNGLLELIKHGCTEQRVLSTLFATLKEYMVRTTARDGIIELIKQRNLNEKILSALLIAMKDSYVYAKMDVIFIAKELIIFGYAPESMLSILFQAAIDSDHNIRTVALSIISQLCDITIFTYRLRRIFSEELSTPSTLLAPSFPVSPLTQLTTTPNNSSSTSSTPSNKDPHMLESRPVLSAPLPTFKITDVLRPADIELINQQPTLIVLHTKILTELNDLCGKLMRLDRNIIPLQQEFQSCLDKARNLSVHDCIHHEAQYMRQLERFHWYIQVAFHFNRADFWADVYKSCHAKNDNGVLLRWAQGLQETWVSQCEFATFSSPLLYEVIIKYLPWLEHYLSVAIQRLAEHADLLKRYPNFVTAYSAYLQKLREELDKKKQQIKQSVLARLNLALQSTDFTYDDVIVDMYHQLRAKGLLQLPKHLLLNENYVPKRELNPTILEAFHLYILNSREQASVVRLQTAWRFDTQAFGERLNLSCVPFLIADHSQDTVVLQASLCPSILTSAASYNTEKSRELFHGQFVTISQLLIALRQYLQKFYIISAMPVAKWPLAELLQNWEKASRAVITEISRVDPLLPYFLTDNFMEAWLEELLKHSMWLTNKALEVLEHFTQDVHDYPVVIDSLQALLSAIKSLCLPQSLSKSTRQRHTALLQTISCRDRVAIIENKLFAINQYNLQAALNKFYREFVQLMPQQQRLDDERFWMKWANSSQAETLLQRTLPYISDTPKRELVQYIIDMITGKLPPVTAAEFQRRLHKLCVSSKLNGQGEVAYQTIVQHLIQHYLLPQYYAHDTPVHSLIVTLDPQSASLRLPALRYQLDEAFLFIETLLTEKKLSKEFSEAIIVNGRSIAMTFKNIHRFLYLLRKAPLAHQNHYRRLCELAGKYIDTYNGADNYYAVVIDGLQDAQLSTRYAIKRFDYLFEKKDCDALEKEELFKKQALLPEFSRHLESVMTTYCKSLEEYRLALTQYWQGKKPSNPAHESSSFAILIRLSDEKKSWWEALVTLYDLENFACLKFYLTMIEAVEKLENYVEEATRELQISLQLQVSELLQIKPSFLLSKQGQQLLEEYLSDAEELRWRPSAQIMINAFAPLERRQAYYLKAWSGSLTINNFEKNYGSFLTHKVDLMSLVDRYGPWLEGVPGKPEKNILTSIQKYLMRTHEQLLKGDIDAVSDTCLKRVRAYLSELSTVYPCENSIALLNTCQQLQADLNNEVVNAEKVIEALGKSDYQEVYRLWHQMFELIVASAADENKPEIYNKNAAKIHAFKQTLCLRAHRISLVSLNKFREYLEASKKPEALDEKVVTLLRKILFFASIHGSDLLVVFCLYYGININSQFNDGETYDRTALHTAAYHGQTRVVSLLLAMGADVRVKSQDKSTPLHSGSVSHNREVIELLHRYGARLEAENNFGFTPLILAASSGSLEGVKVLLENGASVYARDTGQQTALHRAVRAADEHASLAIVKVLLKNGANCDAQDAGKCTPLHLAVVADRAAIVSVLIEAGANTELTDEHGNTPLVLANDPKKSKPHLVELILSKRYAVKMECERLAKELPQRIRELQDEGMRLRLVIIQLQETRAILLRDVHATATLLDESIKPQDNPSPPIKPAAITALMEPTLDKKSPPLKVLPIAKAAPTSKLAIGFFNHTRQNLREWLGTKNEVTLNDGRCMVIKGLQITRGDGNCGFRSILGDAYLQADENLFTRNGVIELLKSHLHDERIRILIAKDLVAKYEEWVAGHWVMERDKKFPQTILQQFIMVRHEQELARNNTPDNQNALFHQLELFCEQLPVLSDYLDHYLIDKDMWPHLQGSLLAFAQILKTRIHCFQQQADGKIMQLQDLKQDPNVAYQEEVFLMQTDNRNHFNKVIVENIVKSPEVKQEIPKQAVP